MQAENLLVAEDGRVLLADFGATAKLEHARYSLPGTPMSESNNSLDAISDGDSAVQSSAPSSEMRIEVSSPPMHAHVLMQLRCMMLVIASRHTHLRAFFLKSSSLSCCSSRLGGSKNSSLPCD